MIDTEVTIREFFEATEDDRESEYNIALINIKAMRRLCAEHRDLRVRVAELGKGLVTLKRWIDKGCFDEEAARIWIVELVGEAAAR